MNQKPPVVTPEEIEEMKKILGGLQRATDTASEMIAESAGYSPEVATVLNMNPEGTEIRTTGGSRMRVVTNADGRSFDVVTADGRPVAEGLRLMEAAEAICALLDHGVRPLDRRIREIIVMEDRCLRAGANAKLLREKAASPSVDARKRAILETKAEREVQKAIEARSRIRSIANH